MRRQTLSSSIPSETGKIIKAPAVFAVLVANFPICAAVDAGARFSLSRQRLAVDLCSGAVVASTVVEARQVRRNYLGAQRTHVPGRDRARGLARLGSGRVGDMVSLDRYGFDYCDDERRAIAVQL